MVDAPIHQKVHQFAQVPQRSGIMWLYTDMAKAACLLNVEIDRAARYVAKLASPTEKEAPRREPLNPL
jgi:hypothetical protein